jgi:pimeloyl-ACP methyl ester carboxylesterase
VAIACALSAVSFAADVDEREPGPKATGKVFRWKAKNGLVYEYRLPKSFDPAKGSRLTIILHGSNLDHRWGFANHPADAFRPDDLVVCPDGTTENGNGGFNSLQSPKDLKRFREFHEELIAKLGVKSTYLYGHSQGSFFALLYAGDAPELVNGVVAHASGSWIGTRADKGRHHQAIVLMHGTADPVVPFGQSVGAYEVYRDAGYPLVRLRALQGWNHWPAEVNGGIGGSVVPHTSQQLAWVEGMTTDDAARVTACFDFLADVGAADWHDWAGLYSLAGRVQDLESVDQAHRERARKARTVVEKLAEQHVAALTKDLGSADGSKLGKDAWVVHLPAFLRDFAGVPPCDALRQTWDDRLAAHQKAAIAGLRQYYEKRERKPADALDAALDALESGFLFHECQNWNLYDGLESLRKGLAKKDAKRLDKRFDAAVPVLRAALELGTDAIMRVHRGAGSF